MKINPEADRLIIYFIIMPVRRSSSVSGQHCMELHPHFRFRYLPKGTYRSVKSLLLSLSNIQLININMTMTRQSSFLLIASALSSARPSSVSAFSLTRLAAATSTGSSSGSAPALLPLRRLHAKCPSSTASSGRKSMPHHVSWVTNRLCLPSRMEHRKLPFRKIFAGSAIMTLLIVFAISTGG